MTDALRDKLKLLPKDPGVYFHKNAAGQIIYVGKAANLRNRVRQYFQKSRLRDAKTDALVAEIADTDWQTVDSELEALFLEAELIRRYMPQYNILLRDDKALTYIRIPFKDEYPAVSQTRRPLDDGADYFGPFFSALAVRRALRYLRRVFPYSTHSVLPNRACLQVHLGLCPGPETGQLDSATYKSDLRRLVRVLRGQRASLNKDFEAAMKTAAADHDYESAAIYRDRLRSLKQLGQQVIFSDKEFLDISKDHALVQLTELLNMLSIPRRIEGYDISHMSGTDVVACMVVFTNGVSNKTEYRKFKTRKNINDDFFNMHETLSRRLSARNTAAWGLPDLLLIDGGKGQLDAAIRARDESGHSDIPCIGLAKREEQLVLHRNKSGLNLNTEVLQKMGGSAADTGDFMLINLPHTTHVVKLLQRIRDESHRFAVSYHSTLKRRRQTTSLLDEIPGIGPATRKKLIRAFGSARGVMAASQAELSAVVGPKLAEKLRRQV